MSVKRILLVGDAGVGKTQFIKKLIGKPFERRYLPTLGGVKTYTHGDVVYYDYPGQEQFTQGSSKLHTISEQIDKVYFVYDTTSRLSFKNLSAKWKRLVEKAYGEDIECEVIGMKSDIADQRVNHGRTFCNK
jgi:GTPase SAR1 family protein